MLRLAGPVAAVQVGLMLMGVVDTMMVGHVSPAALAAAALGSLYFYNVTAFGQGVLFALDPLVAQAVGAGDGPGAARAVQRGIVLALLLSIPLALALLPAGAVLAAFGQPAEVVPTAAAFVRAQVAGVVPYLGFVVLRQTLQAHDHTRAIVVAIVVGNVVNAALNWLLIYGHGGAPALGAVGSAWASTVSRWLMLGALYVAARGELRPVLRPWWPGAWHAAALAPALRLGLPLGAQQALEYGAFGAVGLLMGRLGTVPMAGHQATLNLASLTFMVPLGVSAAAAVRVARAVGAGDAPGARRAAGAATAVGVGFMAASAGVLLAAPRALAGLYTDDAGVLALAATLIPIAGVFQVFDGLQVVSLGVLRGLGDTRVPAAVNVVGFWLFGIPLGAWLGLRSGAGPRGLWWGLVAGLAAVGGILALRVRARLAGPVARVAV
ncbi:MAG TPA: MATE family efflux transporter [Gemmatirosa sp.]